jgi:hypothetical protein
MLELKSLFGSCLDFSKTEEILSLEPSPTSSRKFQIYTKHLSDEEVLEIGKVILEAYNKLESKEQIFFLADLARPLNRPTVESAEFVRTVLELQSSALHKMLLFTSGEHLEFSIKHLYNERLLDILIPLAKSKNDEFASNQRFCNGLRNYYIVPGVSPKTEIAGIESILSNILSNGDFEHNIRLLAFLAEGKESITLAEHLNLDFQQAISTNNHFKKVRAPRWASRASSRYQELSMSMSAKQLLALGIITESGAIPYIISETVLRNRAVAMAENDLWTNECIPISAFLSKQEIARISTASEKRLSKILESLNFDSATHLAVSTALAEVLVERGVSVATKVALELHKLKAHQFWPDPFEVRNSVVAMILLALQPESDEYPFSWFVQFTEYGWLFSEDYEVRELAVLV